MGLNGLPYRHAHDRRDHRDREHDRRGRGHDGGRGRQKRKGSRMATTSTNSCRTTSRDTHNSRDTRKSNMDNHRKDSRTHNPRRRDNYPPRSPNRRSTGEWWAPQLGSRLGLLARFVLPLARIVFELPLHAPVRWRSIRQERRVASAR